MKRRFTAVALIVSLLGTLAALAPTATARPPDRPLIKIASNLPGSLALAVSPDGRTGYLAMPRGVIKVLDLAGGTVAGEVIVGSGPLNDVQMSADGRSLVVTELEVPSFSRPYPGCGTNLMPSCSSNPSSGATYLKRIDTSSLTVVSSMQVRTEPTDLLLALSPSGTRAWIAEVATMDDTEPGLLEVIDLLTNTVIGQVPMPPGTQSVTMSTDGSLLLAGSASSMGNGLTFVDTSTAQVRMTMDLGATRPSGVALSPDASRAWVTVQPQEGGSALLSIDTASGTELFSTALGSTSLNPGGITITSDGRLALVILGWADPRGNGKLSVVDLRTGQPRAVLTAQGSVQSIATAPDGTGGYVTSYTGDEASYELMLTSVQPATRLASINSVTVAAASGAATVRWRSINASRAGIIGYQVSVPNSSRGCRTRRTSCRITGLTPGQSVAFTVTGTAGPAYGPSTQTARVRIP